MLLWKALLQPAAYARAIIAYPPLGATTLGMLLLAGVWVFVVDRLLRVEGELRSRTGFWAALAATPLFFLACWLLLTFLTFGIMGWIGHPLAFEALFCLLAFALAPKYVNWITCPFRAVSLPALYAWRTLSVVLLPSIVLRLWETFRAAAHLNAWQTLVATAPALASLLGITLCEIFTKPGTVRAAYGWRRVGGKRVVVFYPPGKEKADVEAMARESDLLVEQIERFLKVKPLSFRIEMFLCDSSEDLRRLLKIKSLLGIGYAYADHIGLVYGPWPDIKDTVAHELTHTVAIQRLHRHLMPLLNEGLAEYGETQTGGYAYAAICIPLTLSTLAHSSIFYDWREVETPDFSANAKYAHATALVDYLIGRYGMDKFKELCRQTAYDSSQNQAAQFHKAVRTIYGISLQELELNWRREWTGLGQIQLSLDLTEAD